MNPLHVLFFQSTYVGKLGYTEISRIPQWQSTEYLCAQLQKWEAGERRHLVSRCQQVRGTHGKELLVVCVFLRQGLNVAKAVLKLCLVFVLRKGLN